MDTNLLTSASCQQAIVCAPFVQLDTAAAAREAGLHLGGVLIGVAMIMMAMRLWKRSDVAQKKAA